MAVSITLLIAGLMLAVTTNVLGLWRRQSAATSQAVAARLILDQLERDLQTAVHRSDGTRWLALDILNEGAALANHGWLIGPGGMKPGGEASLRPLPPPDSSGIRRIEDARFGLSGTWLRFVATHVESGGSLPTVIAWQLARRPVTGHPVPGNAAPVRYSLYRVAVRAEDAIRVGYDVTASEYASSGNNPYDVEAAQSRYPRNVMNPGHANLMASNVVDFGCWLYGRGPGGELIRLFPAGAGDQSHTAIGGSRANDTRFPAVVDVMVRVISDEGAALVEAIESGRVIRPDNYRSDADWWWALVEAHSAVFSRRIEIKGGTT